MCKGRLKIKLQQKYLVTSGKALLYIDGQELIIKKGDTFDLKYACAYKLIPAKNFDMKEIKDA